MVYFKAVNKSSPAQKGETMKIYKQNILQPNWDSNWVLCESCKQCITYLNMYIWCAILLVILLGKTGVGYNHLCVLNQVWTSAFLNESCI
jgi:hypothetical protein